MNPAFSPEESQFSYGIFGGSAQNFMCDEKLTSSKNSVLVEETMLAKKRSKSGNVPCAIFA